mmetsp:Transcript_59800/g.110688  ORF Transcript_59800/g.110688 Transcript_59800/m.110688 type:complete len:253 (-) Transcript_59800:300-1058(-)
MPPKPACAAETMPDCEPGSCGRQPDPADVPMSKLFAKLTYNRVDGLQVESPACSSTVADDMRGDSPCQGTCESSAEPTRSSGGLNDTSSNGSSPLPSFTPPPGLALPAAKATNGSHERSSEPICSDPTSWPWTTLMLANIPTRVSQEMLMEKIDELGFEDCYDFVYTPRVLKSGFGRGYAFINFCTSHLAWQFASQMNGATCWARQKQPLAVGKASCQGLEQLIGMTYRCKLHKIRNAGFRPFFKVSSRMQV